MSEQQQFLDVIDRDEAERRFRAVLRSEPLGEESRPLAEALGAVLARDVVAAVDVPAFDRSNFDGFALQAAATYGASEEQPRRLQLLPEAIATGTAPRGQVGADAAAAIATGGMLPRGADAVVMIEHTDVEGQHLRVRRAVTPGGGVTFAGTDIAAGETVLRRGDVLTSRETGVLAAIGVDRVPVWRTPRVAVISTGDEILPPGQPMQPARIYDSNSRILADALTESGAQPVEFGIVPDDLSQLRQVLARALDACDAVLLSGGTSKGQGDLCYRVVAELQDPGIVVHGVALKPGKPICLAASRGKPVVILPGFPTSAIFTFHEFVAPVIRQLGGRTAEPRATVQARLAVPVRAEIGRTEYLLVGLVPTAEPQEAPRRLAAYPMGKGSGSVTTFSRADGFVTLDRHQERVEAGTLVPVQLLARDLQLADLVVIGSHCVGLDYLLGLLQSAGYRSKFLAVGSTGGLEAARRGECDLAGIHLLDPKTGVYNQPFLVPGMERLSGYGRLQGVVFRPGDPRFEHRSARDAVQTARTDPECVMVNRNAGSGTRILIDQLLEGAQPAGYAVQAKSHNAVAAAVSQSRADWGLAIRNVARAAGLGFLPLTAERYDFVVPSHRKHRPPVLAFAQQLADRQVRQTLAEMGFLTTDHPDESLPVD